MDSLTLMMAVLGGLSVAACSSKVRVSLRRLAYRLGEDEQFLLSAARAARGRLILSEDPTSPASPQIQLKEFPMQGQMENHGQVEHLLSLGLIEPDESGVPERYVLTPKGWIRVEKFPPLPLVPSRQGAWYNSISIPPKRPLRRS